jgi:putative serine protease PepD
MSRTLLLISCVACAVAGGAVGVAFAMGGSQPAASACQVPQVAEKDLPSVVTVSAKGAAASGTGSGEVIESGGYILTNNHVVAPAAGGGTLSVLFHDGKTAPATLVGRDPLTDIAVIRADAGGLPVIPAGSSRTLVVGQPVVVIGAPLGLSSTVTSGIVSALDRTVDVPGENSQSALLIDAIQTDAAINPGNSGGALVNCSGEFVGIPSAGASVPTASGQSSGGSIGLGFAIPSDLASTEANEIISTGRVTHAYTGLLAAPVSPDAAKVNGVAEGLLVTGIDPGGPARAAGLRAGDIITTIDGQPAVSTDQVVSLTLTRSPGDTVNLGFQQNGRAASASVTLTAQPG